MQSSVSAMKGVAEPFRNEKQVPVAIIELDPFEAPNQGKPTLRSTMTSMIAPRTQVKDLAWPGGHQAPGTPCVDTEQLACATSSW